MAPVRRRLDVNPSAQTTTRDAPLSILPPERTPYLFRNEDTPREIHQHNPEQGGPARAVAMSEAYERERQNNARLDELSNKVSALRGVTVDIYDQASSHSLIENTVRATAHASADTERDGFYRGLG